MSIVTGRTLSTVRASYIFQVGLPLRTSLWSIARKYGCQCGPAALITLLAFFYSSDPAGPMLSPSAQAGLIFA